MSQTFAMPTLVDALRPAPFALDHSVSRRAAYNIALMLGGVALIALAAQLEIRLAISPVTITGQTFAVLLVGALFGAKRGAAAVIAYLALGATGAPVFAGGAGGAAWFVSHTGGYLIGFIAAAFVTGLLAERGWDRRPHTTAAAMLLGLAALYVPGLLWLSLFVGWETVFAVGFVPFMPGCAMKVALATALMPLAWKIVGR
ncbi:MAG TPA: biotin transporter BioY [Phycisphaerales bacterium]|nr:biotin transporter BioY [Phycisphaerales bacterium]HRQ74305.1 biotin transporter BioY [Phycisphaerales bacterium]